MRLASLFTSLATLCTIVVAIPVAADPSLMQMPTPSKSTPSVASTASPSHSASPSTLTLVGAYQCPRNQYKACCQSLEQTTKELMKPVGDLVPIVGGISISSQVSFQCNAMAPLTDPNTCKGHGYTPMCCENNTEGMANAAAEQGAAMNACMPFEKAKETYYQSFGYNVGEESNVDLINDVMS
ncbi:hypothetical protein N7493_010269 [Penicillium malachiteum]|uniref:Hydrophobin n=1 Tax=Penicillium malachiteum TaxID=1324776 RepID=A0AAD6MRC1_9EURO|nr:hypothetical protein N7493_010269 [Penicillium malachiteum]